LRPELGCYGNDHVKSPNIDQLAGEGVLFRNAFCQSAVCNPSRASLLTGLRPDATEVWDLKTNLRTTLPDVVTLPQYFKNNGYKTVCIGKIFHNIFPDSLSWSEPKIYVKGFPFDPDAGYFSDENLSYIEKRKASFIAAGNTRNLDRFGKWYIKASATECLDVPDNTYYDGAQTDIAVKKLEELKEYGKPFFFAVGYYRPHLPFNAPKKYWDLYQRDKIPLAKNPYIPENMPIMAINNLRELKGYTDFRTVRHPSKGSITEGEARLLKHGYYASVSYTDAQIGRLLDQLEKTKLINNTIVILWGDHGWKLGEHNSWAKMTNFEIDTHVPLIIKVPGMPENGKQCKALVEFVDIYPTLCELSGIPVPENLDGLSLKPLLLDVKKPWKTKVFSQFLREGIWKSPDGNPYMGYSIRTERFRYTEWYNWETKEFTANELYDHQSDQDENVNVAGHPEYNEIVRNLKRLIPCPWLQHDRFK
ncbi:MAG: sulfatase, partial [Bacteroidales bacterium]|nr:sulfatase [Bacteroidales bacterium]